MKINKMAKTKKSIKNDNHIEMDQETFDKLKVELEHRREVLRKEIAEEIAQARDLGDLTENYGYTKAMEKKEMNENRISELEDLVINAKVISKNIKDGFVGIGESVEIQNLDTKSKRTVTLVGSEESQSADSVAGKISISSPIGKALYNARIGDVVEVKLEDKVIEYKLLRAVT